MDTQTAPAGLSTKLLTIDELSEQIGIPKATIYSWRGRGEGPRGVKLGGALRYRPADVAAWLEAAADTR